MCGIAGIVDHQGRWSRDELARIARSMADAMPYRGPDDSGVWVSPDGKCALAHRRLSIIDTSSGGHQPFTLGEGHHAISFNGEIYNYLELKQELEGAGHAFQTRSDTEVLLHLLAEQGEAAIERLDGQFAFAHWHAAERQLLLGRDPFGEKPLYWSEGPGWFAFASELHALPKVPGFDATIDQDTIAEYLALQYVDAPRSIYRHAHKLKPGHWLRVSADGKPTIGRHFAFAPRGGVRPSRPMAELADELEHILLRLIRRRMIADVPLGAFLSGGVDSSTVVALMTKALGGTVKTFSIGFENAPDETEHLFARQIAQHLGTDHHDRVLELDVLPLMHHIGTVLDEPNGDSSCLPTFLVSKIAKEQVTVCLSGDGGDEMFGGYGRYFATLQEESKLADFDAGRQYFGSRMLIYCDEHLAELFGQVPARTAAMLASLRRRMGRDPGPLLHRMRAYDAAHYMPGAVLAKVDRMSMQHSLEVRTPFLSRELAAFCEQLAVDDCYSNSLLGGPQGKLVLKEVAQRYIPREWLDRRKMGFGVPTKTGWGRDKMLGWMQELVVADDSRLSQWIDRKGRAAYARRLSSPGNFSFYQAWLMLVLEIWLRNHGSARGEPAEAPPIEVRTLAESIAPGSRQEDLLLCQHLRAAALPAVVFCADDLPGWVHELPQGSLLVTPQLTETPAHVQNRVIAWNGREAPDSELLAALPTGPAVFAAPLREAHADVLGMLTDRGQTILHRVGDRWRARDAAAVAAAGANGHGPAPRLGERLFGEKLPSRPDRIEAAGGFAFRVRLPKLARARALDRTARLVVYENDRRLPHSGSSTPAIVHFGRGRHALEGEWLWFSTSDNSDPTRNGRRYLVALQSGTRGGLLHFLGRTPIAHLALDAREGLERLRSRGRTGEPLRFRFRRPFPHDGGACWLAPMRRMRVPLALLEQGWRAVVLEDGTALGPPDQVHEDVRRLGNGRYSVWDGMIWFASSDNTNPNKNGRSYVLALHPPGAVVDEASQHGAELQPTLASDADFERELAQLAAEAPPRAPQLGPGSKIVMVIGALYAGGTERQLCNLALQLDERGHEVTILALAGFDGVGGHYRSLLTRSGVRLRDASRPESRFALGAATMDERRLQLLAGLPAHLRDEVWRLFTHVVALDPQVLHCCLDSPNISGGVAGLLAGVPRIALGVRSISPENFAHSRPWYRTYYRLLASSPRVRMFANSQVVAEDYARWAGIPIDTFGVIPNGIDPATLTAPVPAAAATLRADLGIPQQAPLLLGLLRLSEEKRPLLFVRSAAAAMARVPGLHAVLAGTGDMRARVDEEIEHLGLRGRLHAVGRREDVATLIAAADVILLTSRTEGCPNALIEAQWLGRPVVAPNVGGCGFCMIAGETGILSDDDAPAALGTACADLLSAPAVRDKMGAAASRFARERFGLENMVERTLALYSDPTA